ncbi:hypothetical protein [Spirosoma areae]
METVQEIKSHLRNGDMSKVGEMLGISRKYANILLGRPTAKLHKDVLETAKKVATANQNLGL